MERAARGTAPDPPFLVKESDFEEEDFEALKLLPPSPSLGMKGPCGEDFLDTVCQSGMAST